MAIRLSTLMVELTALLIHRKRGGTGVSIHQN